MNTTMNNMLRIAALATMGAALALAQPNVNTLKATVPFDFNVGTTHVAAGEYTVESTPGSPIVRIRDERGQVEATLMAMMPTRGHNGGKSYLAFNVYGTKHYLASTCNGATGLSQELRKTSAEREAEIAGVPTRVMVLVASR